LAEVTRRRPPSLAAGDRLGAECAPCGGAAPAPRRSTARSAVAVTAGQPPVRPWPHAGMLGRHVVVQAGGTPVGVQFRGATRAPHPPWEVGRHRAGVRAACHGAWARGPDQRTGRHRERDWVDHRHPTPCPAGSAFRV